MKFKETLLSTEGLILENPEIKPRLKRSAGFHYGNAGNKEINNYQYAFLQLLEEDASSSQSKIWKREYRERVVDDAQSFYDSIKITEEHIYIIDLVFPDENNDRWELVYGIRGGDLMIYLIFAGWDLTSVVSVD